MNRLKTIFTSGFTVTELMVVIAIVAILATLGTAGYKTLMANSQATEVTTALNASLQFAKSAAIHRNTTVTICALSAPQNLTCDNNASTWQYGWMVITNADEVLKTYQTSKIIPVNTANDPSSISFNANGFPDHDFTFTIQPEGCDRGYQISSYVLQSSGEPLKTEAISCP